MQIAQTHLYRLIVEEYAAEEGIILTEDKVDDLLAWVKGGKKPEWAADEDRPPPDPPEVPASPEQSDTASSETYPMEIPHTADMSDEQIVSSISQMIQGKDPEHVSELFQLVFANLPGVELSSPGDEDYPGEETLYTPGAEGRPVAGFQLEQLMELIREALKEGHYHDMGGEDEMYDALDPHGFSNMTDAEIINQAWKDGLEEIIVLDGEGDLANREEVLAAMKDV